MTKREKKLARLTACASAGAMFMGSIGPAMAQTAPDRAEAEEGQKEAAHMKAMSD